MRFATYVHDGTTRAGVVSADRLYPIEDGISVLDLVRLGLPAAQEIGARALQGAPGPTVGEVRLLPPLEPATFRDFVAFEEHVEGVAKVMSGDASVVPEWFQAPTFYFSNPYSMVGAHDEVPVPPGCQLLDFELEVGIVVGRDGSNLSATDARDAIFGYTVLNDWSARDLQQREMLVRLGPAKGKDSATTLGPWLVSADEVEHARDADGFLHLLMTVEVNGVEIGRDLLSNMGWPLEELLMYASRGTWIRAGDVLGTGTCGNGGCLGELWGVRGERTPPPLQPGDVVTMTVEGIGTISNTVVEGVALQDLPVVPPARPRPRDRR